MHHRPGAAKKRGGHGIGGNYRLRHQAAGRKIPVLPVGEKESPGGVFLSAEVEEIEEQQQVEPLPLRDQGVAQVPARLFGQIVHAEHFGVISALGVAEAHFPPGELFHQRPVFGELLRQTAVLGERRGVEVSGNAVQILPQAGFEQLPDPRQVEGRLGAVDQRIRIEAPDQRHHPLIIGQHVVDGGASGTAVEIGLPSDLIDPLPHMGILVLVKKNRTPDELEIFGRIDFPVRKRAEVVLPAGPRRDIPVFVRQRQRGEEIVRPLRLLHLPRRPLGNAVDHRSGPLFSHQIQRGPSSAHGVPIRSCASN